MGALRLLRCGEIANFSRQTADNFLDNLESVLFVIYVFCLLLNSRIFERIINSGQVVEKYCSFPSEISRTISRSLLISPS